MQSVLATVGELSRVAGPVLRPHVGEVLPLVILALQGRYTVAVATLGQVSLGGQQAKGELFERIKKQRFCCLLIHCVLHVHKGKHSTLSAKLLQDSHGHQGLSKSPLLLGNALQTGHCQLKGFFALCAAGRDLVAGRRIPQGILSGYCWQQKA